MKYLLFPIFLLFWAFILPFAIVYEAVRERSFVMFFEGLVCWLILPFCYLWYLIEGDDDGEGIFFDNE